MSDNHIWKPLNNSDFGIINTISSVIAKQEWKDPELFTSIRHCPKLIMASDYGSSYKNAQYESMSFIIADLSACGRWYYLRDSIRKKILGYRRTMSFKKLMSDRIRAKSLMSFLRAADTIPGLLATFLIDKKIAYFLSEQIPEDVSKSQVGKLSRWNEKSFTKLTRIGQLGAMLVAGVSSTGQDVLWITDQDEIASNKEKLTEATNVFAHYMCHYLTHNMGHFRFGTTKSDNGSMELEDLAALPDLAAGAMSELMSCTIKQLGRSHGRVKTPLPKDVSKKAHAILAWLAEREHLLKRIAICIDQVHGVTYKVDFLIINVDSCRIIF